MSCLSHSPEETQAAGRRLAGALAGRGAVVSLEGALGAGKTVFAKGFAAGLGVDPDAVASPTFVIANQYETESRKRLVHADLYRLSDAAELDAAGALDWLAPDCVAILEWGDRFREWLPKDHIRVRLERVDEQTRRIEVYAGGAASEAVIAGIEDLSSGASS